MLRKSNYLLPTFGLLLLCLSPAYSSISLVSHGHYNGTNSGTYTISLTCSAGDVVYVVSSSIAPSLSGETFTSLATLNSNTLYRCVATNSHSASNINFTQSSSGFTGAIMVAYTGVDTSKNTYGSVSSGGGPGTTASASVTTASANSLVLLLVENGSSSPTAGSGYTLDENHGTGSSVNFAEEHANSVTASSGTVVTPTMTVAQWQSWAAIAVALSPLGLPSAPTSLTATAGNAQVSLSWTAPSGTVSSYNLYRGTASGGETLYKTGLTSTSYTDTGVTNGTTYYYEATAVNAAGESPKSNEANAMPTAPPAAPAGLGATAGNQQVTLVWLASTGATSYNLYRSPTSSGSETLFKTGLTATSYTDTGLTNGTTYYYEVTAVNAGGESGKSNEASAKPTAPPGAPTGLTATGGNLQVALSWTAGAGDTSYSVYRGTTSGGESSTPIATNITGTSYTDTSAANGTTYYYYVDGVNANNQTAQSNEASAATANFSISVSPTSLTLAQASSGSVTVTITPSNGFSGNVNLSVSGLPAGVAGTFSPQSASSSSTLTLSTTGTASGGTNTITVTGTSGTLTHTTSPSLNLTVSSTPTVFIYDLYLPKTIEVHWVPKYPVPSVPIDNDSTNSSGWVSYTDQWTITRGGTPSGSTVITDSLSARVPPIWKDAFNFTYGSQYSYDVNEHAWGVFRTWSYVQDPTTQQWEWEYADSNFDATADLGSATVTPMQVLVQDNQTADARWDPRFSTFTYLNFNFGSLIYDGGLFVGYSTDPSRAGRTFLRFPAIPSLPSGSSLWTGSVNLYCTGAQATGTYSVGIQPVADNGWTDSTLNWSNAPSFDPTQPAFTFSFSYNTSNPTPAWVRIPCSDIIRNGLTTGQPLCLALADPAEPSDISSGTQTWVYLAKKEYNSADAAFLLYAYGGSSSGGTVGAGSLARRHADPVSSQQPAKK